MVRYAYALIACLVLVTAGHAAERRVALVIGNSACKQAPLANPGNDARAMALQVALNRPAAPGRLDRH